MAMKFIDMTGKTEEEAIRKALAELGLERDDVSVEILERAKSGFFGIGATPAKVRVSYGLEEETPAAPVAPVKEEKAEKRAEEPKKAAPKQEKRKSEEKRVEKRTEKREEKAAPKAEPVVEAAAPVVDLEADNRTILFATKTCPNCKMAMTFLDKAGMAYEHVIADEDRDLVEQFDIHQAPTLVVLRGGKVEKFVNVSNIRKYIESQN